MRTLLRRAALVVLVLAAGLAALAPARGKPGPEVVPDVVYGHKDGLALTLDVISPAEPNGAGLIWIQSGGWYSQWTDPAGWLALGKPFLDRGLTLFIVRHGSAPRYAVPDAAADVCRSVRFLHRKARTYGVDPERLGVMGASAGGHLALLLGTTGDEGDPAAKDEVLRESSRVAAVVAVMPPTDLRGWVTTPPEAIKKVAALKPSLTFDAKLEPDLSPLLHVTAATAPTLLVHGDKDELVPIEHSKKMHEALDAAKVENKLVVIEGGGHGWSAKQNEEVALPATLDWLEAHLGKKAAAGEKKFR